MMVAQTVLGLSDGIVPADAPAMNQLTPASVDHIRQDDDPLEASSVLSEGSDLSLIPNDNDQLLLDDDHDS